jgi:pyruvate decarboxylase
MTEHATSTVGGYLAARLRDIGLTHFFAVPGDYNLVLLDELLRNPELEFIGCCNELNAGYAADGFARATGGPAAVVVTYSVGGLSVLNAVAGAYAEDLPVIAISGGPNSNSEAEYEFLHHTIGKVDYDYQHDIFSQVTAEAVMVRHPTEAPGQIDRAIATALRERKPVYIEVACNVASATTSAPHPLELNTERASDPASLADAVSHAAELLGAAVKPVLVAGVKLRSFGAVEAFEALANASGYAVAAMPNAKGFFDEQHSSYMGIYWGSVSSPGCADIVESSDMYLYAGPMFTDYTTVGHSALIDENKRIVVAPGGVVMPDASYSDVAIADFLAALAREVRPNDTSLVAFNRVREDVSPPKTGEPDSQLTTRHLFARIQGMLDEKSTVIAETGDSWFNGARLRLPSGARFEIQMQYGSIGWSVGAVLGYAVGAGDASRVVGLIGDGSFQLTAQEISTMIRYGVNPIIFLINNGGYTIEVEIHDGPYNAIKNWDYAGLVGAFAAGEGNAWSTRVATQGELDEAITEAQRRDGLCLIEVQIDRDDCSRELLEWGSHVAKNNGRPPRFR